MGDRLEVHVNQVELEPVEVLETGRQIETLSSSIDFISAGVVVFREPVEPRFMAASTIISLHLFIASFGLNLVALRISSLSCAHNLHSLVPNVLTVDNGFPCQSSSTFNLSWFLISFLGMSLRTKQAK